MNFVFACSFVRLIKTNPFDSSQIKPDQIKSPFLDMHMYCTYTRGKISKRGNINQQQNRKGILTPTPL